MKTIDVVMDVNAPDRNYVSLYRRLGKERELGVWRELSRGKSVLVLGCGTGPLAIAFRKAGYKVTAVDAIKDMLSLLRKRDKKIKIVHSKIEHLRLSDTFDTIILPSLIMNMYGMPIQVLFLKVVRKYLSEKGTALFEVVDERVRAKRNWWFPDQRIMITSTFFDVINGLITYTFKDRNYRRAFEWHIHSKQSFSQLLKQVGLCFEKEVIVSPITRIYAATH